MSGGDEGWWSYFVMSTGEMPVILMSAAATTGLWWAYVSQSAPKLKLSGEMVKKHWSSPPGPAWVRVLALSLTSSVTLGKLLSLKPQFPHPITQA